MATRTLSRVSRTPGISLSTDGISSRTLGASSRTHWTPRSAWGHSDIKASHESFSVSGCSNLRFWSVLKCTNKEFDVILRHFSSSFSSCDLIFIWQSAADWSDCDDSSLQADQRWNELKSPARWCTNIKLTVLWEEDDCQRRKMLVVMVTAVVEPLCRLNCAEIICEQTESSRTVNTEPHYSKHCWRQPIRGHLLSSPTD